MGNEQVTRDERVVTVENAGGRLACIVLLVGVSLSAGLRAWYLKQFYLDLCAWVILSGAVAFFYKAWHRALPHRWLRWVILGALFGAMFGLVHATVMMLLKR